jgi:hypothetical protein
MPYSLALFGGRHLNERDPTTERVLGQHSVPPLHGLPLDKTRVLRERIGADFHGLNDLSPMAYAHIICA